MVELQGLSQIRIFDPRTETWAQSGDIAYARWYPSLVTQPDGAQLTFGGVAKLIKPVYPERPLDSGANERHVERFDPATGKWSTLPDTAAGQVFNPAGQAYDEAL